MVSGAGDNRLPGTRGRPSGSTEYAIRQNILEGDPLRGWSEERCCSEPRARYVSQRANPRGLKFTLSYFSVFLCPLKSDEGDAP